MRLGARWRRIAKRRAVGRERHIGKWLEVGEGESRSGRPEDRRRHVTSRRPDVDDLGAEM
jgi:hypothetical protein